MADLEATYRRADGVIARRIGGECVIVPVTREAGDLENIYSLNEVGARVWEMADGRRASDIAAEVVREFEVEPATAEEDVAAFLGDMEAAGLLTREGERALC